MRLSLLFLTLLSANSCTKYATLITDGPVLRLEDVSMKVSHLDEISWKVGKDRDKEVTQSFSFLVELPKLHLKDRQYLKKERGVDSWILRLIQQEGSRKQDLGSLYAPFSQEEVSRGIKGVSSSVSLKIYFAAAYASERFRSMDCPYFNHRKKIISMEIEGEKEDFAIALSRRISYPEKSQLAELTPASFNGGNSLSGSYFIEIAPYDSKRKEIHAPFQRIPKFVEVGKEETIIIESCDGFLFN